MATLSNVGQGISSILSVPEICSNRNLASICFHGNNISRIEGLQHQQHLTDLNLSSNCITAIEGLQNLEKLTLLNLASNRIQTIQGLHGLTNLQRLSLAHNFISSLAGLSALQGPNNSLRLLDLRNNAISSLQELSVLAACPHLKSLLLEGGSPGNPICSLPSYRAAVAAALPQIEDLDGKVLSEERHYSVQSGEALQYMAALQLQAFQPPEPAPAAFGPTPQQQQQQRGTPRIDTALAGFSRKGQPQPGNGRPVLVDINEQQQLALAGPYGNDFGSFQSYPMSDGDYENRLSAIESRLQASSLP